MVAIVRLAVKPLFNLGSIFSKPTLILKLATPSTIVSAGSM